LKALLFIAIRLQKTSGMKVTRNTLGIITGTPTTMSGIKGSGDGGNGSTTIAGNGGALKAMNGIKVSEGTGIKSATAGNLEATAWSVVPKVVIAVKGAMYPRMAKVW